MDSVRSYLLSVVAVCMLAVLANVLVKQSSIQKVVRLITGLLIVLVVLAPLLSVDIEALGEQLLALTEGSYDSAEVENNYQNRLRQNIKETTEQYIENKATELGAYIQAEVTLSDEEYPIPSHVRIIGSLNYEQIQALTGYLTNSLGIAPEQQEWKTYEILE